MAAISIALACAALFLLTLIRHTFRRKGSNNLRGPASASVLLGNEYEMFHQRNVGELDFNWMREFGLTWRTYGFFGVEQIMTADPKALQHILHKSGYNYPKRVDIGHFMYLTLGRGIFATEGNIHQRQRKVMNPAFSAQQLKLFVPLFQRVAEKLVGKWKAEVKQSSGAVLSVDKWLGRATLDAIGEAAFDFQFGALDDAENPLAKEFNIVLKDSAVDLSPLALVWRATWPYLPKPLLELTKYVPTAFYKRLRNLNHMFADIGRPLYKSTVNDWDGSRSEKRDALSVLIRANISESSQVRLTEGEVLAQMHTLTAAGHETTSNTLTWLFYELAQHPQFQARIRTEIRAARAMVIERGDRAFSLEDLDGMKITLATIKETLRFHPIVYNLWRVAEKDDIIPLSVPVTGKNGEIMTEVPVSAGQPVLLSICGYNRLPEVWGMDADQWNPERFLGLEQEKQIKVGVYANLLTFSAGLRSCLGWRFAMYELQVLMTELVEKFEFSLPEDKPCITRCPGGLMMPLLHKKNGEVIPDMPLHISIAA